MAYVVPSAPPAALTMPHVAAGLHGTMSVFISVQLLGLQHSTTPCLKTGSRPEAPKFKWEIKYQLVDNDHQHD